MTMDNYILTMQLTMLFYIKNFPQAACFWEQIQQPMLLFKMAVMLVLVRRLLQVQDWMLQEE